jgi:hypothetical protein
MSQPENVRAALGFRRHLWYNGPIQKSKPCLAFREETNP